MKSSKKSLVILISLVVVIGGGALGYSLWHHHQSSSKPTARGINSVNYSGPTKEEKAAGNAQKSQEVTRQALNDTPAPKTANLFIVDSSVYNQSFEVRAYVSNVFEDGGTCTATFTKVGSTTVTLSSIAASSATNTQCKTIDIPLNSFDARGDWQFVLSYRSVTATGSTNPQTVTIP